MTDKARWQDDRGISDLSIAIDEIYFLRALLADEAGITEAHLGYKTFPKTRRKYAEAQIERMTAAAKGDITGRTARPISRRARGGNRMTHLTADEQTTLDEAWRASIGPGGSFLILLDVVEGMVSAHRDEAVVMDRIRRDTGTRHDLDDVLKTFGFTRADLEGDL